MTCIVGGEHVEHDGAKQDDAQDDGDGRWEGQHLCQGVLGREVCQCVPGEPGVGLFTLNLSIRLKMSSPPGPMPARSEAYMTTAIYFTAK